MALLLPGKGVFDQSLDEQVFLFFVGGRGQVVVVVVVVGIVFIVVGRPHSRFQRRQAVFLVVTTVEGGQAARRVGNDVHHFLVVEVVAVCDEGRGGTAVVASLQDNPRWAQWGVGQGGNLSRGQHGGWWWWRRRWKFRDFQPKGFRLVCHWRGFCHFH